MDLVLLRYWTRFIYVVGGGGCIHVPGVVDLITKIGAGLRGTNIGKSPSFVWAFSQKSKLGSTFCFPWQFPNSNYWSKGRCTKMCVKRIIIMAEVAVILCVGYLKSGRPI